MHPYQLPKNRVCSRWLLAMWESKRIDNPMTPFIWRYMTTKGREWDGNTIVNIWGQNITIASIRKLLPKLQSEKKTLHWLHHRCSPLNCKHRDSEVDSPLSRASLCVRYAFEEGLLYKIMLFSKTIWLYVMKCNGFHPVGIWSGSVPMLLTTRDLPPRYSIVFSFHSLSRLTWTSRRNPARGWSILLNLLYSMTYLCVQLRRDLFSTHWHAITSLMNPWN